MEEYQSKDSRPERIKEDGVREWYFPAEEVAEWTRRFLVEVDYELEPDSYIGFVRPDFHAKRQTEKRTHEIVGVVCQHFDEALEGLTKLLSIKAVLGDMADYALVLPPVSEFLMLEFFRSEDGQWFWEIKTHKFMVWLANPDEEFVWCILGGPRDKTFDEYFALGKMALDPILAQQLSRWEEE